MPVAPRRRNKHGAGECLPRERIRVRRSSTHIERHKGWHMSVIRALGRRRQGLSRTSWPTDFAYSVRFRFRETCRVGPGRHYTCQQGHRRQVLWRVVFFNLRVIILTCASTWRYVPLEARGIEPPAAGVGRPELLDLGAGTPTALKSSKCFSLLSHLSIAVLLLPPPFFLRQFLYVPQTALKLNV